MRNLLKELYSFVSGRSITESALKHHSNCIKAFAELSAAMGKNEARTWLNADGGKKLEEINDKIATVLKG